ncbi:MAG: hypothetical protein HQL73_01665 [Magnetococcales bacterium]|nr:hypothetical protein [Magnetococcales bacterium]
MVIEGAGTMTLLARFEAIKMTESVNQGMVGQGSSAGSRAARVEISREAVERSQGGKLGVAFPSLLVTEDAMRWNLTRIFMEALFGTEDRAGQEAQTGLADAIVGDAVYEALKGQGTGEEGNQ